MKFSTVLFFCLCFTVFSAIAQSGTIKGSIITSDGKPASLVNAEIKELQKRSTSNEDGGYSFTNIKKGKYTISVSFVGLHKQEKTVEVFENTITELDFVLSENATQLQDVVVTAAKNLNEKPVAAGKIDINPMDLPQSVTVIGKNVLERQQTLRLSEVLMNTNGVYVMSTSGGSQEEIAGRGYAYNSSNTFKNGVRFNNGTMPEVSALEKVEVLKGSTAILFGNVAAGGVLNLVTKKPAFDKGGEVSFRAGSFGFYKPSIDFYGPLANSKSIAYRINTTFEKAKSFRDEVKSERFYINPSLLIKAGKNTDILLEGDHLKDNRTLDYGTGAINYVIADIPRARFLGAKWSYYNTSQTTATATITHHITDNWQLRNITSYQSFNSDLYGTTRPNSGFLIPSDGTWARGLQKTKNEENYYITQFDLTGKFKTRQMKHQLLAGADADKYQTNAIAHTYANAAINNKNIYDTINIFDPAKFAQRTDIPELAPVTRTYTPISRVGIYAQDLLTITGRLKLLAGVRYTYQQTTGGYIDSLQKNKKVQTSPTINKAFTPRFGIVYQPASSVSLFTSYANSFTLNTGTDIYLQPLAPSYINQFEAGIKTELFKKAVSANVTAYQIVNSNLAQTSLTDANGQPNNNNANIKELAGEVTSKGVEVDIMSNFLHGVSVITGYSYNDTRYTKSNTYIVGSKLRYNPQHTANASAHYTFSKPGKLKGLNIGFIAYYVGERVGGRSTRVQVTDDVYKLMVIPGYTQFDISIGYSFNKISLRTKVSNLLNNLSYNVHDDNSVNPIAPRMISASVAYKL
ncbi:TonB-dependent receptor [Segetibacter koreensis]|uniref:TonB-dependent receptor n=1 Tax=Segetibacter koreensis TaxID=398037 RepID=UPI000361C09E|nr:TonB-dependent receptor [Segetibacter koreensis]